MTMTSTDRTVRCNRRAQSRKVHKRRIALAKARGVFYDFPWFTNLHALKTTATPCSCSMCRNPRNQKQAEKYRLTLAEKRAALAEREAVEEAHWDLLEQEVEDACAWDCNVMHPEQGYEVEEEENVLGWVRGDFDLFTDRDWDDLMEDIHRYDYEDYLYERDEDYWEDDDPYCYDEWDYDHWACNFNLQAAWNRGISQPDLFASKEEEVEEAYLRHEEDALYYDGPEWIDSTEAEIAEWEAAQDEAEHDSLYGNL